MAKTVLIVVGHWNIPQITSEGLRSWRDWKTLSRGTGATNEMTFHRDQWMPKLRDRLISAGIQVYIVDAIYHPDTYSRDYDLAILGHYDGGNTQNRCMAAAPLRGMTPPFLFDQAQALSEKFVDIWKKIYPGKTGMIYRPEAVTDGMTQNYAFDYIKEGTPTVLVEHLNISSPEGNKLVNTPDKVADGDFLAICEFLNINPNPVPPASVSLEDKVRAIIYSSDSDSNKIKKLQTILPK
jgi:hypothetical protein